MWYYSWMFAVVLLICSDVDIVLVVDDTPACKSLCREIFERLPYANLGTHQRRYMRRLRERRRSLQCRFNFRVVHVRETGRLNRCPEMKFGGTWQRLPDCARVNECGAWIGYFEYCRDSYWYEERHDAAYYRGDPKPDVPVCPFAGYELRGGMKNFARDGKGPQGKPNPDLGF